MDSTIKDKVIHPEGLTTAPITPYQGSLDIGEYCTVEFPNYDRMVARMEHPPLIANDIDTSTPVGQEQIKSIIYSFCDGEIIDTKPTCSCGQLRGGSQLGLVCNICHTEVTNPIQTEVAASMWVRNLPLVDKFIATAFWVVFSGKFTYKEFNLLEYIVNPDVALDIPANCRLQPIIMDLDLSPEQRNLNFFYRNFQEIMDVIALSLVIRKKPKQVIGMTNQEVLDTFKALRDGDVDVYHVILNTPIGNKLREEKDIIAFIHKMRSEPGCVFTSYIPMLPSAAMVLETNVTGTYFDAVCSHATDAMYAIINSSRTVHSNTEKYQNRKMVQCIKSMATFSKAYIRERAMGKKRAIRSHMFGGRQPFTMRCVIGPLVGDHTHEDLILPWAPTIQVLKVHISNKLLRMPRHPTYGAWTPRTISTFIDDYTNRYHPLLDMILEELIRESIHGIKVVFNRPPSLEKGSFKRQAAIGVSKDPREKLIRMPTNGTQSFNADFDGDMMSIQLILDNETVSMFEPLRPYRSIPSHEGPHAISGAAEAQPPEALTINNFLYGCHDKYNTIS